MGTFRGNSSKSLKKNYIFKIGLLGMMGAFLWFFPQQSWAPVEMQAVQLLEAGDFVRVVYNSSDSNLDTLDADGLQYNKATPYDFTQILAMKQGINNNSDPDKLSFSLQRIDDEHMGIAFGPFDENDYVIETQFSRPGELTTATNLFPVAPSIGIKAISMEIVKVGGQGSIPLNSESLNFSIPGNKITIQMSIQASVSDGQKTATLDPGDPSMGDSKGGMPGSGTGAAAEGNQSPDMATSCNLQLGQDKHSNPWMMATFLLILLVPAYRAFQ